MEKIDRIADYVEIQAWATGGTVSISSLAEDFAAAYESDDYELAERTAEEVFYELRIRSDVLRTHYPYQLDPLTIRASDAVTDSSYLYCLGLSLLDGIPNEMRDRRFEEMVRIAAEKYFHGVGLRIGAPWATEEITEYVQLLNKVSNLIPDLGPPRITTAPNGGDGGWDLVIVKSFGDNQFPRLIALGNCATGKTDWRKKGMETAPEFFWDFFTHQPTFNSHLCFFAVPFVMSDEDRKRKGADILSMDRIRICEHNPYAGSEAMAWLNSRKLDALDLEIY